MSEYGCVEWRNAHRRRIVKIDNWIREAQIWCDNWSQQTWCSIVDHITTTRVTHACHLQHLRFLFDDSNSLRSTHSLAPTHFILTDVGQKWNEWLRSRGYSECLFANLQPLSALHVTLLYLLNAHASCRSRYIFGTAYSYMNWVGALVYLISDLREYCVCSSIHIIRQYHRTTDGRWKAIHSP